MAEFNTPTWVPADQRRFLTALEAAARMELEQLGPGGPLGPGGLKAAHVLPLEKLPDLFPQTVRWATGMNTSSVTTMGARALVSHPGGIRHHEHLIKVFWIVGPRQEGIEELSTKSADVPFLMDSVYADNRSLAGAGFEQNLTSAAWATQVYGGTPYYGWIFTWRLVLQYTMESG